MNWASPTSSIFRQWVFGSPLEDRSWAGKVEVATTRSFPARTSELRRKSTLGIISVLKVFMDPLRRTMTSGLTATTSRGNVSNSMSLYNHIARQRRKLLRLFISCVWRQSVPTIPHVFIRWKTLAEITSSSYILLSESFMKSWAVSRGGISQSKLPLGRETIINERIDFFAMVWYTVAVGTETEANSATVTNLSLCSMTAPGAKCSGTLVMSSLLTTGRLWGVRREDGEDVGGWSCVMPLILRSKICTRAWSAGTNLIDVTSLHSSVVPEEAEE